MGTKGSESTPLEEVAWLDWHASVWPTYVEWLDQHVPLWPTYVGWLH